MHNCMFTGHCINNVCDKSCPDFVESSYLLERNGISLQSDVFHSTKVLDKYSKLIDSAENGIRTVIDKDTNATAELLTYCSICKNWKHSRLHTTVYNLKLSQYIDGIQNSWSNHINSDELEYQRIWISKSKVLIISNIDYINFKDYQCQTLLSLLQSRDKPGMTTIIVSPPLPALVGSGPFFGRLQEVLSRTSRAKQ